jgi:hypothetical protein
VRESKRDLAFTEDLLVCMMRDIIKVGVFGVVLAGSTEFVERVG